MEETILVKVLQKDGCRGYHFDPEKCGIAQLPRRVVEELESVGASRGKPIIERLGKTATFNMGGQTFTNGLPQTGGQVAIIKD